MYTHVCICIYIYRERESEGDIEHVPCKVRKRFAGLGRSGRSIISSRALERRHPPSRAGYAILCYTILY